jgi:integrase
MDSDSGKKVRRRITAREVLALQPGETIWDGAVAGFGARRQQSEVVTYCLVYRTADGRKRWATIGRHGSPWTPDDARKEALRLLGEVVRGRDPVADKAARREAAAQTISALCDAYIADAESGRLLTRRRTPKKASTLYVDKGRIERHIRPLLGRLPVRALTRRDIENFMHDVASGETKDRVKTKKHGVAFVRGGKGTASRTVGLLGAILTYAVRKDWRPDNPVNGVLRYADGRRERRLTSEEYGAFGAGLIAAEDDGTWEPGLAAIRFLLVSGWRRGEVLGLKWSEVDLSRRTARLGDTKTGASMRPLSEEACRILRGVKRSGTYVFKAPGGDTPMAGFVRIWDKVVKLSKLPTDVTPHVLRHSLASVAADLNYGDATIAALLGHKGHSITRRYIHSADAVLLDAADKVAAEIVRLMAGPEDPTRPAPATGELPDPDPR